MYFVCFQASDAVTADCKGVDNGAWQSSEFFRNIPASRKF